MVPSKTFEMYWNNTKQIISKRAISGYFSKAQLLCSSVTLDDVYKEGSFAKLLHRTVKTTGLCSEPEPSARNQWTVSSALLPFCLCCSKMYTVKQACMLPV